jgi:hypothetical protein
MDHNYIDQLDLIDRYLKGSLASEESAQFEEHFVDCPQCIDRLKTTRNFIQDLRSVAVKQASQTESDKQGGLLWFFSQILYYRSSALAASCLLLVAIIGAILLISQIRRLQSEVDQAKSASAQWERRYEEERQSASLAEKRRQEMEQEMTGQLRDLESKLQNEQKQRSGISADSGWLMRPGINLPIFVLRSVRGGGQSASVPANEVTLTYSPMSFAISLALEGEQKYKDYRLTILDDRDRPIWEGGGFKPDSYNSLSIGFNSSFFRSGNYLLKVEGFTDERDSTIIGNYPFRIIKRP